MDRSVRVFGINAGNARHKDVILLMVQLFNDVMSRLARLVLFSKQSKSASQSETDIDFVKRDLNPTLLLQESQ